MNISLESRGKVMRRELDDISKRIEQVGGYARLAIYESIVRSIGPIRRKYMNASESKRRAILKVLRNFAAESWKKGDWPAALGLGLVALNVESQFVPGTDAAFVKADTALLILKAAAV